MEILEDEYKRAYPCNREYQKLIKYNNKVYKLRSIFDDFFIINDIEDILLDSNNYSFDLSLLDSFQASYDNDLADTQIDFDMLVSENVNSFVYDKVLSFILDNSLDTEDGNFYQFIKDIDNGNSKTLRVSTGIRFDIVESLDQKYLEEDSYEDNSIVSCCRSYNEILFALVKNEDTGLKDEFGFLEYVKDVYFVIHPKSLKKNKVSEENENDRIEFIFPDNMIVTRQEHNVIPMINMNLNGDMTIPFSYNILFWALCNVVSTSGTFASLYKSLYETYNVKFNDVESNLNIDNDKHNILLLQSWILSSNSMKDEESQSVSFERFSCYPLLWCLDESEWTMEESIRVQIPTDLYTDPYTSLPMNVAKSFIQVLNIYEDLFTKNDIEEDYEKKELLENVMLIYKQEKDNFKF